MMTNDDRDTAKAIVEQSATEAIQALIGTLIDSDEGEVTRVSDGQRIASATVGDLRMWATSELLTRLTLRLMVATDADARLIVRNAPDMILPIMAEALTSTAADALAKRNPAIVTMINRAAGMYADEIARRQSIPAQKAQA